MHLSSAGRRFTVHGLEGRTGGLYDDSLSDPSDSSRVEVNDDLISVYKNLTKEASNLIFFGLHQVY